MPSDEDMLRAYEIGRKSDAVYFFQNEEFMAFLIEPEYVRPPHEKQVLVDEYSRGVFDSVIDAAENIE